MRKIHRLRVGDSVEITNDLEGGNADFIRQAEANRVEIAPRDDGVPHDVQVTGPISCYNVCVLLRNEAGKAATLTIDVIIPPWLTAAGFGHFLKNVYYERAPDGLDYAAIPPTRAQDLGDRMRLAVELAPGEQRVFCSVPQLPYSACVRKLRGLARRPEATLAEIGRSALGRPVYALELEAGDGRPRLVVTGTLQAGEPTAWPVLAMAEWLLDSPAGRRGLGAFRVDLVPQPNPDGNVLGLCNTDSQGAIPELRFTDAAAGRPCPVETQNLWDYLAQSPPLAYAEFHCHRLANHQSSTMGFPTASVYGAPARAALVEDIARDMVAQGEHGRVHRWGPDHPFWGRFCVHHAAQQLNAITYVDQYTGAGSSLAGARQRGPELLSAFLEALAARA